jgi:hypothetical protein
LPTMITFSGAWIESIMSSEEVGLFGQIAAVDGYVVRADGFMDKIVAVGVGDDQNAGS